MTTGLTILSIVLGMAGALLLCVSAFYWQRSNRLTFSSTEGASAHDPRRKLEALSAMVDEKIRLNARARLFVALAASCQAASTILYMLQRVRS